MKASILISNFNRLSLLKRTLWSIANRPPSCDFEVILADDGSTDDILAALRLFSSAFPWTFISVDTADFESKTGITKFFNCPSLTNNIAFRHSRGEWVFQQGNEVIAWEGVYNRLIADIPQSEAWLVMSTTYDLPQQYLEVLDEYGSNLNQGIVDACSRWPLQSCAYRSDVTNYISLAPRSLWDALGGYDERYLGGISGEDSDFVRRARRLPGFQQVISKALSLHQYHRGKTCYYEPHPSVITLDRFREGCSINRVIYNAYSGETKNLQGWKWGTYGVKDVIKNG